MHVRTERVPQNNNKMVYGLRMHTYTHMYYDHEKLVVVYEKKAVSEVYGICPEEH